MSFSKRYSTVHDFASLRLRPDGTRVTRKQADGKSQKYPTHTVKDHRGNWIAQDAGGTGRVKTRYAARQDVDGEEGEDEELKGENVAGPSTVNVDKGKGRALEEDLKDPRAKRRKLFAEDVGIYDSEPSPLSRPSAPSGEGADVHQSSHARPNPSSDLLKCIHYFASTYYSEMGQLRDASKEYRREKKLRRLKRQEQLRRTTKSRSASQLSDVLSDQDEERSSGESSDTDEESGVSVGKGKKVSKRRQAKPLVGTDMYKILDGSALMAIGMLIQHHVESLATPRVPQTWEEDMRRSAERSREVRPIKRVKSHESEDLSTRRLPKSNETLDDSPADFAPQVDDDSEDEDYIPD